MQTSNSIDNIINQIRPDVIDIKYKFLDDIVKTVQMPGDADIADLEQKLLEICHFMLYEINDMRTQDNLIAGSEELPFDTLLTSLSISDKIFMLKERTVKNGKFFESEYNTKFIMYMQGKEDEKMAKQMQEEYYEDDSHNHRSEELRENITRLQQELMNSLNRADEPQLRTIRNMLQTWMVLGLDINRDILNQIEQRLNTLSPGGAQQTPPIVMEQPMLQSPTSQHIQIAPGLYATIISPILNNTTNADDDDDNNSDDEAESPPLEPSAVSSELPPQLVSLLNGLMQYEDVKVVNTREEIESLKIMKFVDLSKKKDNIYKPGKPCDICLEEYEDQEDILILECNHYYHCKCIKQWLSNNRNVCPICKKSVLKGKPIITE